MSGKTGVSVLGYMYVGRGPGRAKVSAGTRGPANAYTPSPHSLIYIRLRIVFVFHGVSGTQ